MDRILEGILSSSHPEAMKKALIEKIRDMSMDPQPVNEACAVLRKAVMWMLQGDSDLQVSAGKNLFSTWSQHHPAALENLFTHEYSINLITKAWNNKELVPDLLMDTLKVLKIHNIKVFQQRLRIVSSKASLFVKEIPDIDSLKKYLLIILDFDAMPSGDTAVRLTIALMHFLARQYIPAEEKAITEFTRDILLLTVVMRSLWKQLSIKHIGDCLCELFNIISAVYGPEPSICLGTVTEFIPAVFVKEALKSVVDISSIPVGAVQAAVCRLIDWLAWPTCVNIDKWVICLLDELVVARKFSTLIIVIRSKVEQVLEKMQFEPSREESFNILYQMLLGFQHSPEPFHKVLQMLPNVLEKLQAEGTPDSIKCRTNLAELIHCLMYRHPSFHDLYSHVADLIKDVPSPSESEMTKRLLEAKWLGKKSKAAVYPSMSFSGMTGLFNLGNTCYMNSILQTLFMCDLFRKQVLEYTPAKEEEVLEKLKYVFASLQCSQRPAISPKEFHSVARPDWFIEYQQQDCSEFLKCLLNRLHEQKEEAIKRQASECSTPEEARAASKNKSDGLLVRELFGGKVNQTTRCLSCFHISHTEESFTDISLAFPQDQKGSHNDSTLPSATDKSLFGGANNVFTNQPSMEPTVSHSDSGTSKIHLSELLRNYLSVERLEGENQYQCERCKKKEDAERTIGIVACPEYLILTLLRFGYDAKLKKRSKILREVSCPRTLCVPVEGHHASDDGQNSSTKRQKLQRQHELQQNLGFGKHNEIYGLCSIVIHSGETSDNGHYYCFARNSHSGNVESAVDRLDNLLRPTDPDGIDMDKPAEDIDIDLLEDQWFKFNDSNVSKINFNSIRDLAKDSLTVTHTPYVLVYKRLSPGSSKISGKTTNLSSHFQEAVLKDDILPL